MIAPVLSLAATGLSAAGSMVGAEGQAKSDEFAAQQAELASQYGTIKAAQTGTAMTRNMTSMLGHIAAVRASAGADARSPTTAAIQGRQEEIATTERGIQVGNIEAQAREDQLSSKMYTDAAGRALTGGLLGAAGAGLKGIGGAFQSAGSPGGGSISMGSSFNFFGNG